MRRQATWAVVLVVLAVWLVGGVAWAQGQAVPAGKLPVPAAAQQGAAPDTPRVEELPAEVQQQFGTLTFRAQVKQEDVATLQKEVDGLLADRDRLLQRAARPGFDIRQDPQTGKLIYVEKPKAPADAGGPKK